METGVELSLRQKLARHSDPKLTANIYTHPAAVDRIAAVEKLLRPQWGAESQESRATGTEGATRSPRQPGTVCGAVNGAVTPVLGCPQLTTVGQDGGLESDAPASPKPLKTRVCSIITGDCY
jgi:hypothetical protein